MNRLTCFLASALTAPLVPALAAPGPQDSGGETLPGFDRRAYASLPFAATDRQAALIEQLQRSDAQRYMTSLGGAHLHVGALPDNLGSLDPLGPLLGERSRRYLSSAEFEKKMGRAVGVVTLGLLRETGPGGERNTVLALRARPTTAFTSLSVGYAVTPRSALMAMASYGKTEGYGSPDSLMAQVSSVRTVAFSVGWSTRHIFDSRDRIAVTWSVPAKVRTGAAQGHGLTSAALHGQGGGATTLNLQPTATERDLEFGYTTTVGRKHRDGRGGKVTGAVMLRLNPGHDAQAGPDWLTGVRYSYGF